LFEDWAAKRHFTICLEFVSTEELNKVLERFFTELRKQDGTNYEPDSLQTMLATLECYFHMNNCPYAFAEARRVLNGKAIELHEKGLGKEKTESRPFVCNRRDAVVGHGDPWQY
jgi:hypothetical protein